MKVRTFIARDAESLDSKVNDALEVIGSLNVVDVQYRPINAEYHVAGNTLESRCELYSAMIIYKEKFDGN